MYIQKPLPHLHKYFGTKKNNKGIVKVLIVNSGNANAHTGEKGIKLDQY